MENQEYLTINEAAEKLKLAKVTIYRMARRGQLPAVKLGKAGKTTAGKV